jgi:hypothetical protein
MGSPPKRDVRAARGLAYEGPLCQPLLISD